MLPTGTSRSSRSTASTGPKRCVSWRVWIARGCNCLPLEVDWLGRREPNTAAARFCYTSRRAAIRGGTCTRCGGSTRPDRRLQYSDPRRSDRLLEAVLELPSVVEHVARQSPHEVAARPALTAARAKLRHLPSD